MRASALAILTVLLPACIAPGSAFGQAALEGARLAALSGAGGAIADDLWGRRNPAAWASRERAALGVCAAQLYGMDELRAASALVILPIRRHVVALGASTFGFKLYRHQAIDLGYARGVGVGTFRRVAIGIRLRSEMASFDRYGRIRTWGITGGLHVLLTPRISLGATLHNVGTPTHLRLATSSQPLSIGVSFHSTGFLFAADIEKDARSPARIAAGVEVTPVPVLVLRGGVASTPRNVAWGIGLRMKPIQIDVAASVHYALGWSPTVSAVVVW